MVFTVPLLRKVKSFTRKVVMEKTRSKGRNMPKVDHSVIDLYFPNGKYKVSKQVIR